MRNLLHNKVIIVTESSSDIGRAIASRCAQQAAIVVLHHSEAPRDEMESLAGAAHILIDEVISTFGHIDILEIMEQEQGLGEKGLSFTSAYLLSQMAASQMTLQGQGGSIISISPTAAASGFLSLKHDTTTRNALLAISEKLAIEFGKHGIRHNCIIPAATESSMMTHGPATNGRKEFTESRVPLGRLGRPEDIANAVLFLARNMSDYITGQQIVVDGCVSVKYNLCIEVE
ncbi:short-chain dehydrogenase/reductase SDR [Aspergillus pseudotamarii]|uniref:Short-chain dehydrogenase/reductase SDR n=1 Tax=Aspergillus pseudotamarii TaxID=132259 RepID=A0A5N6TBY6_ASPPS|nr:short-chain dehydrogenase/reductase SDR [Aspergillus pseudotamarii]KAE8143812.1 short-chain dehydrogenase/reductase SDR [Aspergillus pseudotamarii]